MPAPVKSWKKKLLLLLCATVLVVIVTYLMGISSGHPFHRNSTVIYHMSNNSWPKWHISHNAPKFWTKKAQLCIMFNFPQKEHVIKLLLRYYTHFFDDIMIIFDGNYSKKPHFIPDYVKFSGCESRSGCYHQKCLNICLRKNKPEGGYLYVSDDMFVNLTLMNSLPKSRIWFADAHDYIGNYTARILWTKESWYWFQPSQNMLQPLEKVVEALPPKWKQNLVKNIGFPDRYHKNAYSDLIYVPKTLAQDIIEVLTFQSSIADMFLETAIILAVDIVAPPNQTVYFEAGDLWGSERNNIKRREVGKRAHFVHPIKLSQPDQAKLWREFMDNQLRLLEGLEKIFKPRFRHTL